MKALLKAWYAIAFPFHGFRFEQHGDCIQETQGAIPKLKIKTFPIKVVGRYDLDKYF